MYVYIIHTYIHIYEVEFPELRTHRLRIREHRSFFLNQNRYGRLSQIPYGSIGFLQVLARCSIDIRYQSKSLSSPQDSNVYVQWSISDGKHRFYALILCFGTSMEQLLR